MAFNDWDGQDDRRAVREVNNACASPHLHPTSNDRTAANSTRTVAREISVHIRDDIGLGTILWGHRITGKIGPAAACIRVLSNKNRVARRKTTGVIRVLVNEFEINHENTSEQGERP